MESGNESFREKLLSSRTGTIRVCLDDELKGIWKPYKKSIASSHFWYRNWKRALRFTSSRISNGFSFVSGSFNSATNHKYGVTQQEHNSRSASSKDFVFTSIPQEDQHAFVSETNLGDSVCRSFTFFNHAVSNPVHSPPPHVSPQVGPFPTI